MKQLVQSELLMNFKLPLQLQFTTSHGRRVGGGSGGWALDFMKLMLSQPQLYLDLKFKLNLETNRG